MVRFEFVWKSNENISSFKLKGLVKDFTVQFLIYL